VHQKKCPLCPATFEAESLPVADNLLSRHIAVNHAGWSKQEVDWTMDDLKILEGMKISPQ
jgi:hypothetical protein